MTGNIGCVSIILRYPSCLFSCSIWFFQLILEKRCFWYVESSGVYGFCYGHFHIYRDWVKVLILFVV